MRYKAMNRLLFLISILCLIHTSGYTQVTEIKKQAATDSKRHSSAKGTRSYGSSSSSSSFNDDESFGEYILGQLFMGIAYGVGFVTVEAQKHVLAKQDQLPNLVSFESGLDFGTNLSEFTFNPSIRGNWGLFATDFRYSMLHDYSGTLQSLDWQVVVVRVPIHNLKLNYGAGFTSLLAPKTTYFESSAGFDLCLLKEQLKVTSNYRWTTRKTDERYRQEFKFTADYKLWEKGRFQLAPSIGVTYQDYFKKHHYWFANMGIRLRIH